MMNLLERMEADDRVKLSDYYADKYPAIYQSVLIDLEKNVSFTNLKFGTACDLSICFQCTVGDIVYLFTQIQ
tara:strand:+ start:30633 stop:30848 length:216 start_codon:yes stop_codon:yes gene_type:complete